MCLAISKPAPPSVAERPIPVYVLRVEIMGILRSPMYTKEIWEIGETNRILDGQFNNDTGNKGHKNGNLIYGNAYHSFKKPPTKKQISDYIATMRCSGYKGIITRTSVRVCMAEIPQGAEYYEGNVPKYNNLLFSGARIYASDALTMKSFVDRYW
jgi:hypothetical protein